MHRSAASLLALLAIGACGTSEDDRPATLPYITEAILKPSCAVAQCHSSMVQADGYVFDTVDMAKDSLSLIVAKGDAEGSLLVQVMTRTIDRMPYDQPIPNADIDLISAWITDGADGL